MSSQLSSRRPADSTRSFRLLAVLALLAAGSASAQDRMTRPLVNESRVPKVQIAILLDNSGSMQGLLNQARSQLWKIVNTFGTARRNGVRPRLELALYEYGDGVRQLSGFTTNLDAISEMLFSLGIRGGDEYCGQVIHSATQELEWSGNPDDLKLIYIAGNEPFTQGPVQPQRAIRAAQAKGISVNIIHCGGDEPTWRQGAVIAQGDYFMINHNAAVAQIIAPQDVEIARLGAELNRTYVGYGRRAAEGKASQARQDANAVAAAPAVAAERAKSKASAMYDNSTWDLVDAAKSGAVKLEAVPEAELPEEMKGLDADDRKEFVAKKQKEREEIQAKIAELSKARDAFIADAQKKQGSGDTTLDTALIQSVRSQGEKKAFTF